MTTEVLTELRPLNERQRRLLDEVDSVGPVTTAKLAKWLGETVSATHSALRRLEKRGLIKSNNNRRYDSRYSCTWTISE